MARLTEKQIASLRAEERSKRRGFELIGQFIFWFSQLEFTIKTRLGGALSLPDELFDAITSPYDFAMLCTVTSFVLCRKHPSGKQSIEEVFKQCRALNDERVRIAHGMWTHGPDGVMARHVSRSKLEHKYFYEHQGELTALADRAQHLMNLMFSVPRGPVGDEVERLGVEIMPPKSRRREVRRATIASKRSKPAKKG